MYNRAKSQINIESENLSASFHVYDTINDARIFCENLYLIIKRPNIVSYVRFGKYESIYKYMKGVLYNAKES